VEAFVIYAEFWLWPLVAVLVLLEVMAGARRRARARDRLGKLFVLQTVRDAQIDISEAVHKSPTVTRRAS
jgi:hypothetical protein